MTDAKIKAILNEMRSRYAIPRKKAADELVRIGAPAVPMLIETLNDKIPEVRQAAADALARIGTPEALIALKRWYAEKS